MIYQAAILSFCFILFLKTVKRLDDVAGMDKDSGNFLIFQGILILNCTFQFHLHFCFFHHFFCFPLFPLSMVKTMSYRYRPLSLVSFSVFVTLYCVVY